MGLFSCDTEDFKLSIYNQSSDTVFYNVKSDTIIRNMDKPNYFKLGNDSPYAKEGCLIPGEKEKTSVINTSWERWINKIPDKKVKIFFYKKTLLNIVKWDDIIKNQYYSKRLEFTVEELEELDWIVVYSDSIHLN